MIELYGSALCPFVQRIRLVLAEKQLAAAEIEIDPRRKPAKFLAMSPTGKIPLLVHDGARVWESAVISEYLDEIFPERPLLPDAPAERALARSWINFADVNIYEPSHRLLLCPDPGAQAKLAQQIADELRVFETHALAVNDGPYVLGAAFSLADIALFPWFEQLSVLERFRGFRMPAECKRLPAWREAVARRASVRCAMRPSDYYLQGYTALLTQMQQGRS
jgi:glutathione S-transferase